MRGHRKLDAFKLADELTLSVYRATQAFPVDEKFELTSQIRRAAVSIGANIAEESARATKAEYLRFLGSAFSSGRELEYLLWIAKRLDYIAEDLFGVLSKNRRELVERYTTLSKRYVTPSSLSK